MTGFDSRALGEMNLLKRKAIDRLLLNLVRRKIFLTNDRLLFVTIIIGG